MSKYRYIYFAAVDRPLNDSQLEFMEEQSTRAEISRWEFANEYHFGGFRGDANEMLRRGYDVHLHFANFGIRKLAFRLPRLPCKQKVFAKFEIEQSIEWRKDKRGAAGILVIEPEADAGTFESFVELDEVTSQLPALRQMLLESDLRPLYLAWLACAWDNDAVEPPVPSGLKKLDRALEVMAEFYEIPIDLIAAAAAQSPKLGKRVDRNQLAEKWIRQRSKAELQQLVTELALGDAAAVRAELLNRIREATPADPIELAEPSRTLAQLQAEAGKIKAARIKQKEAAAKRAQAKKLKKIVNDPDELIRRINTLVAQRTKAGYHEAAECLDDLAEAIGRSKASQVARRIYNRKTSSIHLKSAFRQRGWKP